MKLFKREKKNEYNRGRPDSGGGDRRRRILDNRKTFRGLKADKEDDFYYDEETHIPSGVSDDSFLEFDYEDFYEDEDANRGPDGLKNSRYMEADEFREYLDTRNSFSDMGYDRAYIKNQKYYDEMSPDYPGSAYDGGYEDRMGDFPEDAEPDLVGGENTPFAVADKNRKIRLSKIRRAGIITTIIIVLVAAAVAGLIYVDKKGLVNIEEIAVNGISHYNELDIIDAAKAKTDVGLVTVRTTKMVKRLEALPYVKTAGVSREFPHRLVINVNERVPVYAIYFGGFYLLADKDFVMLDKVNEAENLVILEGYIPSDTTLGEKFVPRNEKGMEVTVKMLKSMQELGLNVYKMSYKSGLLNVYFTKTIMVEGSYDNIMAYVGEINEILYSLGTQGIERGTIHVGDNGYISFSPII